MRLTGTRGESAGCGGVGGVKAQPAITVAKATAASCIFIGNDSWPSYADCWALWKSGGGNGGCCSAVKDLLANQLPNQATCAHGVHGTAASTAKAKLGTKAAGKTLGKARQHNYDDNRGNPHEKVPSDQ